MSYSAPLSVTYNLGSIAFGASSTSRKIRVPKGMRFAKVREIMLDASVAFAGTTPPKIQLGNDTTANKYADFNCSTTGVGAARGLADETAALVAAYADRIDCGAEGENLTALKVSLIAGVGGVPAGTGVVSVVIDWY